MQDVVETEENTGRVQTSTTLAEAVWSDDRETRFGHHQVVLRSL
jgi:hypothetical protein